jgi:hypothetical protein
MPSPGRLPRISASGWPPPAAVFGPQVEADPQRWRAVSEGPGLAVDLGQHCRRLITPVLSRTGGAAAACCSGPSCRGPCRCYGVGVAARASSTNTQPCPVASWVVHSGWPGTVTSQHSSSGSPVRRRPGSPSRRYLCCRPRRPSRPGFGGRRYAPSRGCRSHRPSPSASCREHRSGRPTADRLVVVAWMCW